MEPYGNEQIIQLLDQAIELLDKNDDRKWAELMRSLRHNYIYLNHSKDRKEAAFLIMKSMLGGMGSLSDVVLHKEGKPLIEENSVLDKVLDELYVECKRIQ
jgi:hypothetical protein